MKTTSHAASTISDLTIPARILIGVTGHRHLAHEHLLTRQVHRVLELIKGIITPLQHTPVVFSTLSPLAEGADSLVSRAVLDKPGSRLEAVLPMEKKDYLQDFEAPGAADEFERLLSQAYRVKQLTFSESRGEAYIQAGRYVVEHCDVLIALWDGNSDPNSCGTSETVRYAREKGVPLFWINTQSPETITFEQGKTSVTLEGTDEQVNTTWKQFLARREKKLLRRTTKITPFHLLDQYNAEAVAPQTIEHGVQSQVSHLLSQAEKSHFSAAVVRSVCDVLLPHFVRADHLAIHYQRLYQRYGSLLFTLSAAAVATVAFQGNYMPKWPQVIVLEMLLMIAILTITWLTGSGRWHQKWIDYRFLAERLRSAIFMSIAHIDLVTIPTSRPLSSSFLSTDWMVAAFSAVASTLPRLPEPKAAEFAGLKKFLISAWLQDQISFHERASKRHYRRNRRMEIAGTACFVATFFAALLHVLQIGPFLFLCMVAFIINAFPSFGATLGAIRTHRELLKNSKRSEEMVRQLYELKEQLLSAENLSIFFHVVREAEQTILRETDDWHIVVKFRDLEFT